MDLELQSCANCGKELRRADRRVVGGGAAAICASCLKKLNAEAEKKRRWEAVMGKREGLKNG